MGDSDMLLARLKGMLRSPSLRGGMTLVGASVIAQLIVFGATPLLTRLYSPEDFGFLSMALAVSAIVAPAACLRLESALLLPKEDRDASALLYIGAAFTVVSSGLTAGILHLVTGLGMAPELAGLDHFSLWAAALVLTTALFSLASQFALRNHQFAAVARRSVYQAVATAVAQIGLAGLLTGAGGLMTGQVIGRTAGTLPLIYNTRQRLYPVVPKHAINLLREYWRFPLAFMPATLLNGLGLALPLLFVGVYYSVSDAGQWGMADRLLSAPVMLLGTAFGQVTETRLAAQLRAGTGNMTRGFLQATKALAGSGALLVLGVLLVAPSVLPWFFGPGWESAIALMQILSLSTAFRLVAGPTAKALVVLQRAGLNLALDAFRVGAIAVVIAASVTYRLPLEHAAIGFTIAMSVVYLTSWIACLKAVRTHDAHRRVVGGTDPLASVEDVP